MSLDSRRSSLPPNPNRREPAPRELYTEPELAWGERVWGEDLDAYERERSLELWYELHGFVDAVVEDAIQRFGRALLFDIHSYNYQRERAIDWREDAAPTINLGTAHLRLDGEGGEILDRIRRRLDAVTVLGEACDFRENAVFHGGYVNRRMSRTYGPRRITVSVEFKKVFMEERSGVRHEDLLADLAEQWDDLVHDLGDVLGPAVRDPPSVPEIIDQGE